jgi:hypothetical protein
VAVPITPSKEEFLDYAQKMIDGEDVSDYEFEKVDFDGPDKLEKWTEENRERAKNWANMPYFVTDNPKYVPLMEDTDLKNYSQAMQENFIALETSLGVKRGSSMTFEEANEMRGNPHYGESEAYRINCQTCVVANELRRRGFPVEALPNLKGSVQSMLSHKTESAWLDADGNIPSKYYIGGRAKLDVATVVFPKVNWKQFKQATSEPGRYHVDWIWKRERCGHIVTFERFADGTGRWYDPQTGAINFMTRDYASRIKGMSVLRVDNLTANPEVCGKVLTKASSEAVSGTASKAGGIGGLSVKADKESYRALAKKVKASTTGYDAQEIFSKGFYTHRMSLTKNDMKNLFGHCFEEDELYTVQNLPSLLNQLKNPRYNMLNLERENIKKKIANGAIHFVEYELEFKGRKYCFKTEVIKSSHKKFVVEHPYSLRLK